MSQLQLKNKNYGQAADRKHLQPNYFVFNDLESGDIHKTSRVIDSIYL